MFNIVLTRGVALVAVLLMAVISVTSAQGTAGQPQSGIPELLAEVRALRAEINQVAGASMRMQLLLARLTLQEQRIASLGRQVAEVQEQLRTASRERSDTEARLRQVEDLRRSGKLRVDDEQAIAYEAKEVSGRLAAQTTREAQLRGQESELLAALAAEQSRWTDFNARLDELERALPPTSR